jgi:pyrroloquinoline quinone (PQQ) biosynthesis protein C
MEVSQASAQLGHGDEELKGSWRSTMTGQPYDGRNRFAPEWSNGDRPDVFEARLVETAVKTQRESFPNLSIPSEYTQAQARLYHATWLTSFSYFAWRFPSWLLEVAARCPYQDIRREIIEDCTDEEVGDEDAGGRCHVDVLYEEAEACGISREEIASTEPTPLLQTCILAFDDLARTLPWEASYAAIGAMEIISSKPAVELRSKLMTDEERAASSAALSASLPERLGLESEDLMFGALHQYKDQFHGGAELALLVKYATDARIQAEMLWAARTSLQVLGIMLGEGRRVAIDAVG